jgi:microsomal dipeptidase-like Zn-dependent dipeptidase
MAMVYSKRSLFLRIAVVAVALVAMALATVGCPPGPVVPPPPPRMAADAGAPPAVSARPRPPGGPGLTGFVDLHTHPLSSLGFAGKLLYGGVDWAPSGGALLPADPDCRKDVHATSAGQALGHDQSTHGSWGVDVDPIDLLDGKFGMTNPCGDAVRQIVISAVQGVNDANNPGPDATGFPAFSSWPEWNDVTHQIMWIDSIKRAYDAGLSVMVALTVNNQTLGDSVAGPGDGPSDDMSSSDLQIREIKALVSRHSDWMAIADSAENLKKIVEQNKLAIVLGMEVDNIGDFNKKPGLSQDDIRREIARLYDDEGVRYVFPVHLIDNSFGTTAAYLDLFNLSNLREAGHFWNLQCAPASEHIHYAYQLGNPLKQAFDLRPASTLTAEMAALMVVKLGMLSDTVDDPVVPPGCDSMWNIGEGPYPGLTPNGQFAMREMMRRGMLIDIDHMSQASLKDALDIAKTENYPVNSGHNTVRTDPSGTERNLTADEYATIASLHGMAGVGGARSNDVEWLALYAAIRKALGDRPGAIGFGTDADGMSPLMRPPPVGTQRITYTADFPKSALGTASWDYNVAGVAHYGMLADFMRALSTLTGGQTAVADMMSGAQYFYDSWSRAEQYAAKARGDGGAAPVASATALRALATAAAPAATTAAPTHAPCTNAMVFRTACNMCLAPRANCPGVLHPVCDASRTRDKWGVCWTKGARPVAAVPAAPVGPGPSLVPGAYTLVLVGTADPETKKARQVAGFAVDIVANGRRVTLRGQDAKPTSAVQASGGFRGNRFIGRVSTGQQVLVLTGVTLTTDKVTKLRGTYVAHSPDVPPVSGIFVLQQTATLKRAPTGLVAYDKIGEFLDQLRK